MSRTTKDKKWKLRHPENDWTYGMEKIPYQRERLFFNPEIGQFQGTGEYYTAYTFLPEKGARSKKRKDYYGTWNWWAATPSWWTRMMMNRPQRREAHLWEHDVARTPLDHLEEVDKPNASHKPHIYYY